MNFRKLAILIAIIMLIVCCFKACNVDNDDIKWTLTEEDYTNRKTWVYPSAVSNNTVNALRESLRETCESVVPKGYTLVEYFAMHRYGRTIFDDEVFECWVLVENASGEKEAIVLKMPNPKDVELMDEFIHSDKRRVPQYEVCLAPPAEEEAHYYLRIIGYKTIDES